MSCHAWEIYLLSSAVWLIPSVVAYCLMLAFAVGMCQVAADSDESHERAYRRLTASHTPSSTD